MPTSSNKQSVRSTDGDLESLGGMADSAASSDAGTFSLIALIKRLLGKLTTQLPAALGANGALKVEGVAGGTAQPVSGTVTVTQGTAANLKVDASGVPVPITDNSSTISVDDGGASLTVDGSVTVTQSTAANLKVDASGAAVPVTDNSGSLTVDQSTASNFNAQVVGSIAHDGVDSGNPLKVGHKAIDHGTNPTAVAAGDRTDSYANRAGIPFMIGGHPNIVTRQDNYTAAQTNTAIVTVAAGLKIVVTRVLVTCANANTVDVSCTIGFGAASVPANVGVVAAHPGIAKGGGFNSGDGSGILGIGADGEDLRITCSVPTTGSITVVTSYYTIES